MCDLNANKKPLPIGGDVFYRASAPEDFKPGLRHVFELAIYAGSQPVPGEIQLVARLHKRFGRLNVGIRKDAAAAVVIRIVSEPLTRPCGKLHIAHTIARTARQHYGATVPIRVLGAQYSVCMDRSPAFQAA
jgi:hypothetical protein